MSNNWLFLQRLIAPDDGIALVLTVNDDGTSVCVSADGTTIILVGDTVTAGDFCRYDKNGLIVSKATQLAASAIYLPDIDCGLVVYGADSVDNGQLTDPVNCIDVVDCGDFG